MSIFRLLSLLGLTIALASSAQSREAGEQRWSFKEFPIGGWVSPRPEPDALKRYKDANFTIMIAHGEKEAEAAQALDLPVLLQHDRAYHQPYDEKRLADVIAVADRRSNVVGHLIFDEPDPRSFPELGRWTDALRKARPNHVVWVNLHPVKIVEEELPGVTTYEPYLDKFIETTRPDVLSYDNYGALRESNDDIYLYKNFEDSYVYYNMGLMRDRALAKGLPFWGFALTTPHWTYFTPTEADIRFQVYSLLAYGAKGLWHFTYGSVPGLTNMSYDLRKATEIDVGLIRTDGTTTDRYEIVKRVNGEVRALGPTLLKLTSISVHHLDEPKVPRRYFLEDPKEVPELKREPLPPDSALRSVAGGRPLVGLFKGPGGGEYVMVMNKERRKMEVVTRVAMGEERRRDEVKPGTTLGQKFHASKPITAVSLIASSYSEVMQSATIRLKAGGPEGKVVAVWRWHNLFANNAVIMRFPKQPAGEYYLEVGDANPSSADGSRVNGRIGWWSVANADGKGNAHIDGRPDPRSDRNFIAYGEPDHSGDELTMTLGSDVKSVEEVDKANGSLVPCPLKDGRLVLPFAQGDGRLFKITHSKK